MVERPENDQGDRRRRYYSCHGQSPNRTFCGGTGTCLLLHIISFFPYKSYFNVAFLTLGPAVLTHSRAQILQAIGIDYIDESEVLTPADEQHHINKHTFRIPFVCGATSLGTFFEFVYAWFGFRYGPNQTRNLFLFDSVG